MPPRLHIRPPHLRTARPAVAYPGLQFRRPLSSPKRPPPPPRRRALYDVALVTGGCLAVAATLIWIKKSRNHSQSSAQEVAGLTKDAQKQGQFEIPIASRTGSPATKKTLTMLTQNETDRLLRKGEATYEVNRPGNPVYRYDINAVASNSPIEDDSVITILSRPPLPSSPASSSTPPPNGDLLFFGIFDGHAGWSTSKLLSEKLVPYVGRELESVLRGDPEYAAIALGKQLGSGDKIQSEEAKGTLEGLWQAIKSRGGNSNRMVNLDADPSIVAKALENGFVKLDDEIVYAPVKELERVGKLKGWSKLSENAGREMSPEQTKSLQTLLPALSGSCAQLAYIDTARSQIHVATTGDSRALMGVWEPNASGSGGKWRAEILSEDQEGTNPKEIERMKSEHPASESDQVISRGRVLGGLQPTRAFGDARYKWARGVQEELYSAFYPGQGRRPPSSYLTPPYVTARPVVTSTPLPSPDAPSPPATPDGTKPQAFVVMATDGLWDRLTNEEVVGLVGAYLEGAKGTLRRKEVLAKVGAVAQAHVSPHNPRNEAASSSDFVFEDSNLSTHLIRNSLGGAARDQVSALLSIPAPHARRYRDDVTVTVVLLGSGHSEGQVEGVKRVQKPLAKL